MPDTTSPSATPLRPALASLAAAPHTTSVRRLWKAISPEERSLGISASFNDDENGWVRNTTRSAVAAALKFRPQTVGTWPKAKLISEAVRLPIDDAQLLSAYLVDLHLGHRRPMMGAFLDTLGIKNEDGRIDSETTEVPEQDAARITAAADSLVKTFPAEDVVTYFLTLLLQDAAIWAGVTPWLESRTS